MKLLEDAHDYGDGHKQHENGELTRRKPEKADWFVDFSLIFRMVLIGQIIRKATMMTTTAIIHPKRYSFA